MNSSWYISDPIEIRKGYNPSSTSILIASPTPDYSPNSRFLDNYWNYRNMATTEVYSVSRATAPPPLPENPPHAGRKIAAENQPSLLLTDEENQRIFTILGKGKQTLATAVVQVLVASPNPEQWSKKDTGVCCFVRDTLKRSYYIQVFNLQSKSMVFRQEIYNQFEYDKCSSSFMTFEGDKSMVGLNFADSKEASRFFSSLDQKLELKKQRKERRKHSDSQHFQSRDHIEHSYTRPDSSPMSNGRIEISRNVLNKSSSLFPKKGRKKEKPKLRKEDIGNPTEFRHVQHVGFDPKKGFDADVKDESFQKFFAKVGISAELLDKEKEFIYRFIEEHGGKEAVQREMLDLNRNNQAVEKYPAPSPPKHFTSNQIHPANSAPDVPSRQPVPSYPISNSKPAPPPPPAPTRPVPPPPPPARTTSVSRSQLQAKSNHNTDGMSQTRNYVSQTNGPAPPPPPPPMREVTTACAPPPPPPPPMPMPMSIPVEAESLSNISSPRNDLPDDRSQLMKQIQKGIQLKKVDPEHQPRRLTGGISDCLTEIQKGVDLKPVPENTKAEPSLDRMDGLAGALARALAERSKAINPDSSSSEDEEDDDDWD